MEDFIQYLDPQLLVVVAALLAIGYALKSTPKVPDWLIGWVLLVVGPVITVFVLDTTIESVIQGLLTAAVAGQVHQLWKQTIERK